MSLAIGVMIVSAFVLGAVCGVVILMALALRHERKRM